MSLRPAGNVLFVVTSHDTLGATGHPTGFWLPELTHLARELEREGYDVDIASPRGGLPPIDPRSHPDSAESTNRDDDVSREFLASAVHQERLNDSLPLSDVDPTAYEAVVFTGGNGAIFDFPDHPEVQRIARSVWEEGGVVAALCHGVAALLNVKLSDGGTLLKGRTVTGFSTQEEHQFEEGVGARWVPFYLQEELIRRGAYFECSAPFTPHVTVSGRVVTGQNNVSGAALGQALVQVLAARRDGVRV
jgi:putative intracellular protease/amidase